MLPLNPWTLTYYLCGVLFAGGIIAMAVEAWRYTRFTHATDPEPLKGLAPSPGEDCAGDPFNVNKWQDSWELEQHEIDLFMADLEDAAVRYLDGLYGRTILKDTPATIKALSKLPAQGGWAA